MTDRHALPADESAGWVLLLPQPRERDHVLCIELNSVRNAEALAYWYERVTALTLRSADGRCVRSYFEHGALVGQEILSWRPDEALPFGDGLFTVVACRLIGGASSAPWTLERLQALILECRRVASATACVYFDIENPWSYKRLRHLIPGVERKPAPPHTRFELEGALRRAGFRTVRAHPFLVERGSIIEVLPPGGYRPARHAWAEQVKRVLLGRVGSRLFAAAFGITAYREGEAESIVSGLQRSAAEAGLASPPQARGFSRMLVGTAKSFVQCGERGNGELMYVVPSRVEIVQRRRTELSALRLLQESGLSITRLLPKVAREFEHCRRPVFGYEFIKGWTIDAITPKFDLLIRRAYELLRTFNQESLRSVKVGEAEFTGIVGHALDSAAERYPYAASSLQRLRAALRARLLGRIVPVVWLHGDYKLENLIFESTRRIRAVIDWELSAKVGLLLCDLLYLIGYASITYGDVGDLLEAFERMLLPGQFPYRERALIEAYIAEFHLTPELIELSTAVFLVHHVGIRFYYDVNDPVARQRIVASIDELSMRLEQRVNCARLA